jgi:hypothetical protein
MKVPCGTRARTSSRPNTRFPLTRASNADDQVSEVDGTRIEELIHERKYNGIDRPRGLM